MTYYLILQAGHLYLGTCSLQTPHSCITDLEINKQTEYNNDYIKQL